MASKMSKNNLKINRNFLRELTFQVRLIYRLIKDSRVNIILKVLPLGTLVYFLVPDLVIGPIDDAAIIWLGSYLFVELCPAEVVAEHTLDLSGQTRSSIPKEDIIEGTYREVKEGEE